MSDGDQALSLIYLFGCLLLVASALTVSRLPLGKTLKMALAWALIFAAGFAIFALRDDFRALGRRIWGAVTGAGAQEVTPQGELRIALGEDGHFWADGRLNGEQVRFLIDSGATVTTIDRATAERAGIAPSGRRTPVSTANGIVYVDRARADRLMVGPIERSDLAIHIAGDDSVNVIGMNFLSTLSRWSVEGRSLVLRP